MKEIKANLNRMRNASIRGHNNDPIELEAKNATRPFWAPHATELTVYYSV